MKTKRDGEREIVIIVDVERKMSIRKGERRRFWNTVKTGRGTLGRMTVEMTRRLLGFLLILCTHSLAFLPFV